MDNKYTFEEVKALAKNVQDRGVVDGVHVYIQAGSESTEDCLISAVHIDFNALANIHAHILLEAGPTPLLAVLDEFGLDPLTLDMLTLLLTELIKLGRRPKRPPSTPFSKRR